MTARLPGRPRRQAEARAEFDRHRARWISTQAKPQTAALLYGNAEHMHRWRIQLDCGHIHEVLTRGKDRPPAGERWINCLGDKLAQGEYPCYEQSCHRDVDRDIVSWDKRQDKETPPDPEDPPDWWGDRDPALWARTRRTARGRTGA
ncbi:MAG TPA: hypothetical protein VGJ50_22370 [Streptosporangiaceae bacterium]|jgi:hypothetical protein